MHPFSRFLPLLVATGLAVTASAAPVVLYDTGWEASPANPAWVAGAVSPQNGWQSAGGSTARIRVTTEGTADATVFGTPYTTPYGAQMMRFTASSSTTANNAQFAWPDITGAFSARPGGYDRLVASIDMLVPAGGSADASAYGLLGFSGGGNVLDFGFIASPAGQVLALIGADGAVVGEVPSAFAYNTWFNVAVEANYQTGEILVRVNGVPVPGLSGSNPALIGSALEDVDLYCENDTLAPNPRVVFTDNYRVTVQPLSDGPPPNDAFAQAQLLAGLSGSTNGTTLSATVEVNEPEHAAISPTRSVWYRWVAPVSGSFTFDTLQGSLDTVVAVYTGSSLAGLVEVGSNDDATPGSITASRATFAATAGTTYRIAVDSKGTAQGGFNLRWRPTVQLQARRAGDNLILTIKAAAPGFYQLQDSPSLFNPAWVAFDSVNFTDAAGGTTDYDAGPVSQTARRFFRVTQ
jgi:hypothetical protein